MTHRNLNPIRLSPANEVDDQEHLQFLVASMRDSGWNGRPLLVEEVRIGSATFFEAWTGSHRIEAAKQAKLHTVPCVVIEFEEAKDAFQTAGYSLAGAESWRGALSHFEGPTDMDRLKGLEKTTLLEAIELVEAEIRDNRKQFGRQAPYQTDQL